MINAEFFLTGNYPDSLNDARTATELRPDYLKAIARGMISCKIRKLKYSSFGGTIFTGIHENVPSYSETPI